MEDFYNTGNLFVAYDDGGRHGRDRMVVEFATTYAISAYYH
jgi:hypothetical protein